MSEGIPEPLEERLPSVRAALRDASRIVVCLDFDGTLAPIVEDPDNAKPLDSAVEAVQSLASDPSVTTAVVSGRGLSDVRSRIDGPTIFAGNHGLEIQRSGSVSIHPIARKRIPLIETVCSTLADAFEPIPHCRVENKQLTGTVHLRSVPDPAVEPVQELTRWVTAQVGENALELSSGKRVLEISPSLPWGKGNAVNLVQSAVAPNALTIYVGDDTTDESAFQAIEPTGIGIRVGGPEPSHASYRVRSPSEAASVLHWIEDPVTTDLF